MNVRPEPSTMEQSPAEPPAEGLPCAPRVDMPGMLLALTGLVLMAVGGFWFIGTQSRPHPEPSEAVTASIASESASPAHSRFD